MLKITSLVRIICTCTVCIVTECPEGFIADIYKFQCYLFVEGIYTWYNASSICESKNAYLAELVDPDERDAVWRYAKSKEYLLF